MIFYIDKLLPDGRILSFHKITETKIDFATKVLTPIIGSWALETDAINNGDKYLEFYVEISFTTWNEALLNNLETTVLNLPWQYYKNQFVPAEVTPPFNLVVAKIEKAKQLASQRLIANLTSFTYNTKDYSANQTAQNDLNAIANYASLFNALPASFPNAWQAIDGTVIAIPDVTAFKSLYSAMVAQGAANFIKMQTLLYQANAATNQAQLEAINW